MSKRKLERFSKRKYLNMMILKVPTSFDWEAYKADESNADTVEALEAMRFQVNGDYPNSQEYNGKKLMLCQLYGNRGDFTSTKPSTWTVAGFEGESIVQNRVLDHLLPDVVITQDDNGDDVVTEVPITDCTGRLCTIAGRDWTY